MRLYCFSHFMLSPMAKGIQALHSTVEMFNKYTGDDNKTDMLYNWSNYHKTCVVLNGGVSSDLDALEIILNTRANPYPWASFYEDESLGNLLTSLSIVLPEHMYETANLMRKYPKQIYFSGVFIQGNDLYTIEKSDYLLYRNMCNYQFSVWEQDFVAVLITSRLAS